MPYRGANPQSNRRPSLSDARAAVQRRQVPTQYRSIGFLLNLQPRRVAPMQFAFAVVELFNFVGLSGLTRCTCL